MGALATKGSKFKPNSVVVITGGSQGLGRSLALEYASRGCKVVVNARGQDAITEVIATCKKLYNNNNVVAFAGDVSKEEVCKELIAFTLQ